jgi:Ca2+-transporting ATPase
VTLETGDAVPCDGILVRGSSLKTNESALTGEADEVKKSPDQDPFCIASSQVVDGMGTMLAVAVGVNSVKGRITDLMMDSENVDETVLQKKLTYIAELIGKVWIFF